MKTALLLALAAATPAGAALTSSAPDGFVSRHEAIVDVPPARAWTVLTAWHKWWSPAHSYSGTPPVLTPKAGGGLVESWPQGEVLHALVLNAQPPKLLRLGGGFGPLQGLPVNAILDFTLAPAGEGTRITLTYRVAGNAAAALDKLAAPVDAVMGEGFARLTRFATTGKPE